LTNFLQLISVTKTDPYETSSTVCQTSSIQDQEDRVTMKLDVAHTEHSHLIGRSGHCVKAMMLDTSCHIHFPDSNRAPNVIEKSNQVSISGRPNDVERARKRIRVSFSILLPLKRISILQRSITTYKLASKAPTKSKPISGQLAIKEVQPTSMDIFWSGLEWSLYLGDGKRTWRNLFKEFICKWQTNNRGPNIHMSNIICLFVGKPTVMSDFA
uniref:KH domain-containing protein n=1 Tax=Hymenolepis diminuta TaxID=6216 RepID=A0A0R3SRP6_HYMDI